MKNSVVAGVALVMVAVYSLFTFFYVADFTDKMEQQIYSYEKNSAEDNIKQMRLIFEKRKKVLNIVINKEHLNEVENKITVLENCLEYNDEQKTDEYIRLLGNSVNEIKQHNVCVI